MTIRGQEKLIALEPFNSRPHRSDFCGDWILDRLFGTRSKERPIPNDFGIVLTEATVDATLESIRKRQLEYRHDQPREAQFIKSAVEEIKQQRH